jgi:chemotaxis protein methyltransferase CheR
LTEDLRTVEHLEIALLLEGVYRRFGLDYRGYRPEPMRRKLHALIAAEGVLTVSGLQEKLMHDAAACERVLHSLGSRPASLFGDSEYALALREVLVPWLRSCASPRIWVAECASAEEVCGLAILLEEEGLHHKTQIFATAANEDVLQEAKTCRFPTERMGEYAENYLRSGGRGELSRYVGMRDGEAVFAGSLTSNVVWAQYSLATDASFNEFQMISCRGAMAEFGSVLRHRTLQLFYDSMPVYGLLSVELEKEGDLSSLGRCYRAVEGGKGLYRKVG